MYYNMHVLLIACSASDSCLYHAGPNGVCARITSYFHPLTALIITIEFSKNIYCISIVELSTENTSARIE